MWIRLNFNLFSGQNKFFFWSHDQNFCVKEKFHSENFTLYLRDIIKKRSNKKEKSLIQYKFFSGFVATNEEKTEQIKIFHFVQWCPLYTFKSAKIRAAHRNRTIRFIRYGCTGKTPVPSRLQIYKLTAVIFTAVNRIYSVNFSRITALYGYTGG